MQTQHSHQRTAWGAQQRVRAGACPYPSAFFSGPAPEKKAKESIKTGKSYLYRTTTTTTTEDLPHAYIRRRKKNHTFLYWPPNRNYLSGGAGGTDDRLGVPSEGKRGGEEREIHTLPRLLFTTLPHSILVLSPPAKTSASKKKHEEQERQFPSLIPLSPIPRREPVPFPTHPTKHTHAYTN